MERGASSSHTVPSTASALDRPQDILRLEAYRTESAKVASEIFAIDRDLAANPSSNTLKSRSFVLKRFRDELSGMTKAELSTHKPISITGSETGPTEVPRLLHQVQREETVRLKDVKDVARTGDLKLSRQLARDVVRIRKEKDRLFVMDANNKYRTIKTLLELMESRHTRFQAICQDAETAKFGENTANEVLSFASELLSDHVLLLRFEREVRRQLKFLASKNQVNAAKVLAQSMIELQKCNKRVQESFEQLDESANDDVLKAGIQYLRAHISPSSPS